MTPLAETEEQYDAMIKFLQRAQRQVGEALNARVSPGIAFDSQNPNFKKLKPKRVADVYVALVDILNQAKKERSMLKGE